MRRDRWDPQFDRGRPAFEPIGAAMAPFRAHTEWPTLEEWNAALPPVRSTGGAPIHFVLQPPKSRGAPRDVASLYDERIYTEGAVSSRVATWHDFFNMLVWASFPEAKRAINARQRRALRARIDPSQPRLPSTRTEEQDVLAMIDEGGLLIVVERDEEQLRADVLDAKGVTDLVARGDARVMILGHAIYEHLVSSDEIVRGLGWLVGVSSIDRELGAVRAEADASFAAILRDAHLERRGAPGLPVEGALFGPAIGRVSYR